AQLRHFGHIHAMDGGHMRRGALGHHHVFGDLDAHLAHRLDASLGHGAGGGRRRRRSGCRRSRLREVRFHILPGDAPAGSGSFDLAEVEVILAGHLADQRGERSGRFRRRRGGGCGRRGGGLHRRGGSGIVLLRRDLPLGRGGGRRGGGGWHGGRGRRGGGGRRGG